MIKYACLSTYMDDDQPPHMQPTEQEHQVSTNLSQKIITRSLNTHGLVTGSLHSEAPDVCNFLDPKQVDICVLHGESRASPETFRNQNNIYVLCKKHGTTWGIAICEDQLPRANISVWIFDFHRPCVSSLHLRHWVTRRTLQTPGTAEEHKRQETPTINPIGPTNKPHRPSTKHGVCVVTKE